MITLTLKGLRGKNALSKVDLNCDLGESFGAYRIGNDETILEHEAEKIYLEKEQLLQELKIAINLASTK